MKYEVYKPNPQNSGCACSFNVVEDSKGRTVMYLNMILQASWNAESKTGSFSANFKSEDKSTNVMFNLTECGEMLAAFNHRYSKTFYHKSPKGTKSITLSPWDKTEKTKTKTGEVEFIVPAFGLKVVSDGSKSFSIPLLPGEIENIKALITQGMYRNYGKKDSGYTPQDDVQAQDSVPE
jgi:hypothetical protein